MSQNLKRTPCLFFFYKTKFRYLGRRNVVRGCDIDIFSIILLYCFESRLLAPSLGEIVTGLDFAGAFRNASFLSRAPDSDCSEVSQRPVRIFCLTPLYVQKAAAPRRSPA